MNRIETVLTATAIALFSLAAFVLVSTLAGAQAIDVAQVAHQQAQVYGASEWCMDAILQGEGQMNPYPPVSQTGDHGPAQWHQDPDGKDLWHQSPQGKDGQSIDDPVANISALAWALVHGYGDQWNANPGGC